MKRYLACMALAVVLVSSAFAQTQAEKDKALKYLESTKQGVIDATKKGSKGSILPGLADEEAVANFHFITPVLEENAKSLLSLIQMGRDQSAKKIDADTAIAEGLETALSGRVADSLIVHCEHCGNGHCDAPLTIEHHADDPIATQGVDRPLHQRRLGLAGPDDQTQAPLVQRARGKAASLVTRSGR